MMSKADAAIAFALEQAGWWDGRFLPKTVLDPVFGCRLWTASKVTSGAGVISVATPSSSTRTPVLAHRVAYAKEHGFDALPRSSRNGYAQFVIEHSCGNLACVEPGHLVKTSAFAVSRRRYDRS
jgi:hypothetical protein